MNDDSDLDWWTKAALNFNWSKGPLSAVIKYQEKDDRAYAYKEYSVSYDWGLFTTQFGKFNPITKPDVVPGGPGGIDTGNYNGFNDSKNQQLVVKVPLGPATLSVAGVRGSNHQATVTSTSAAAAAAFNADTDTSQPALEARMDFTVGPFAGAFFGGMYEYEEVYTPVGTGVGEKTYDIDSNVIGFAATMGFGPLTFTGDIFQDTNNYNGDYQDPLYIAANDSIMDYETTGWQVALEYQITPMFSAAVRYGEYEIEADNVAFLVAGDVIEDDQSALGISLDIDIMPGMGATIAYVTTDYEEQYVAPVGTVPNQEGDEDAIKFEWWIKF